MKPLFFTPLAFCIISTFTIKAQKQKDSIKTQLEEIKIDSHRYNKKSTLVKTITQQNIEFGNYQNTADMLSNSGHLFVQKSQQGGGSPIIRGFEANRILLIVDGVRMNNLIFRGGHLQNSITVDENMLEKTDLLFGAFSTAFGSDALGGAIHLITKKPLLKPDNNNRTFKANINSRYTTINQEKSIYTDLYLCKTKWGSLTAFSFNDFDNIQMGKKTNGDNPTFGEQNQYIITTPSGDQIINNNNPYIQKFSGYKQYNGLQKLIYKPNTTTEHLLNLQYATTNNIPRYDRLTDRKAGNLRFATWAYGPQERLLTSYKFSKNKAFLNSDFTINASYQKIQESRITREFLNSNQTTRTENVKVYALSADFKANLPKAELLYGAEIFYDLLQSTATITNLANLETKPTSTRYPDGKNNTLRTDLFATYYANLTPTAKYHLGLRTGYVTLHSNLNNNPLKLPFTTITQKNYTYSATAGITNNPTPHVALSYNLSTGFRTPNIDDLAKIFESGKGTLIVPNNHLKPEKTITNDLNITLNHNQTLHFENNLNYTLLYDAIVTNNFKYNNQETYLYEGILSKIMANQNSGKASIFSFSSTLKINLSKHFKALGTYNYTYGKIHSTPTQPLQPLDHIPPQYGKIAINYQNKWLKAEAYLLYNGKKNIKDYLLNAEDNEQYAPKNGMPAWQTYNIKLALNTLPKTTLYTGIENILDTQYRTFASGINAPGRTFYLSLNCTL